MRDSYAVYIRFIANGMKAEHFSFADRGDRKFIRGAIVGSANGSVRCKESAFHPFVLTVQLFQNTFRQCNGCSAGSIQFVDMMCLAHGDIISRELIHDFSQILVESGEDADSQAEVGRPEECFAPFRAELLDFFAMLGHPSGTARYQFYTGFERFHIIAVSYHRIGKLNGHIGLFYLFAHLSVTDQCYFHCFLTYIQNNSRKDKIFITFAAHINVLLTWNIFSTTCGNINYFP